jgi:hypothetical protein
VHKQRLTFEIRFEVLDENVLNCTGYYISFGYMRNIPHHKIFLHPNCRFCLVHSMIELQYSRNWYRLLFPMVSKALKSKDVVHGIFNFIFHLIYKQCDVNWLRLSVLWTVQLILSELKKNYRHILYIITSSLFFNAQKLFPC